MECIFLLFSLTRVSLVKKKFWIRFHMSPLDLERGLKIFFSFSLYKGSFNLNFLPSFSGVIHSSRKISQTLCLGSEKRRFHSKVMTLLNLDKVYQRNMLGDSRCIYRRGPQKRAALTSNCIKAKNFWLSMGKKYFFSHFYRGLATSYRNGFNLLLFLIGIHKIHG